MWLDGADVTPLAASQGGEVVLAVFPFGKWAGKKLAVKIIDTEEVDRAAADREVNILKTLSGVDTKESFFPNLLAVVEEVNKIMIVMECVEGEPLSAVIKRTRRQRSSQLPLSRGHNPSQDAAERLAEGGPPKDSCANPVEADAMPRKSLSRQTTWRGRIGSAWRWWRDAAPPQPEAPAPEVIEVMDASEALEIVERLTEALNALHLRGICFRDLKASNVMIVANKEPVLIDFGHAVALQDPQVEEAAGTPHAMLPEILERAIGETSSPQSSLADCERIGKRRDFWALGVLLYEMLFGEPPFGFVWPTISGQYCAADLQKVWKRSRLPLLFPPKYGLSGARLRAEEKIRHLLFADQLHTTAII